jgi:hypothetical protein
MKMNKDLLKYGPSDSFIEKLIPSRNVPPATDADIPEYDIERGIYQSTTWDGPRVLDAKIADWNFDTRTVQLGGEHV